MPKLIADCLGIERDGSENKPHVRSFQILPVVVGNISICLTEVFVLNGY